MKLNLEKLDILREDYYKGTVENLHSRGSNHLTCCTGFGKTIIAKRLAIDFPNYRILYVSDRKDAVDLMQKYFEEVSKNGSMTCTYASLSRKETIGEKLEIIPEYDLIIFDESHLMGAHNCDKVVQKAKECGIMLLGSSASPRRTDGINVAYEYFDGNILEYSLRQASEDNLIVDPFIETTVYLGLRLNAVKERISRKTNNKWAVSQLNVVERAIADRDSISASIGKAVEVSGEGIWIVFHPNIKVLNEMRPEIDKAFYKHLPKINTYAVSSDNDHMNMKEFLSIGETSAVIHGVDMITTGWHLENMSGAIFNSTTDSPIKSIQQIGRIIELGCEKRKSIVDIAGRFSSTKNRFIEDTVMMGGSGNEKSGTRPDPVKYSVDTNREILELESILNCIEQWSDIDKPRMTFEEAVELRRKVKHQFGHLARSTGIEEEMLKKLLAEEGVE